MKWVLSSKTENKVIKGIFVIFLALAWLHFERTHFDYRTFNETGRLVLQGRIGEIYQPHMGRMGGFLYPMIAAYFFAMLTWLGEWWGRLIFYGFIGASVVGILRFSVRAKQWGHFSVLLLLALGVRSIGDILISGNVNVVLLALVVASFVLKDRRPVLAGIVLGFAGAFKNFPLLFFFFFLLRGEWRVLFSGALSWVLFFIGPFFLRGWEQGLESLAQYQAVISNPDNYGGLYFRGFQNLSGFFNRFTLGWGWSTQAIFGLYVLSAIALLSAFFILPAYQSLRRREQPFQSERAQFYAFAMLLALCPLITPVFWYNLGVAYYPLLALTLATAPRFSRFVLMVFFVCFTVLSPGIIGPDAAWNLESMNVPFFGTLFWILMWLSWRKNVA